MNEANYYILNTEGVQYVKKPIPIKALPVIEDGEVQTLEGVMKYKKGDLPDFGSQRGNLSMQEGNL